MMLPIELEVQKKPFLPIVEVKAKGTMDPLQWISFMLGIIEKAESQGGKLFEQEPTDMLELNTIFCSLIFESGGKAAEFIWSLQQMMQQEG